MRNKLWQANFNRKWKYLARLSKSLFMIGIIPLSLAAEEVFKTHTTSDGSTLTARHEASSVVIGSKFYLMGGRGLRPLEVLDTDSNKWSIDANSSFEINHFQPVVWNGKIYAIGAFTGAFPNETNISVVKIYNPNTKTWSDGAQIPESRRRGSTGTVVYNNKIYIHGGNTNGHDGGGVPWFDEYDPSTNTWTVLPDSPNARDHYSAVVINNKFVAAGGRSSHYPNFLANKVSKVDVYNFQTGVWENNMDDIPTPRAGTSTVNYGNEAIVLGGEATPGDAESAVESLNISTGKWRTLPSLITTRHGMGSGIVGDVLYVASGNKVIGGGQELTSVETLKLGTNVNQDSDGDGLTDTDEINKYLTDPDKADTDGDTLNDGVEVNTYSTNPLKEDTDDDLLSDGDEVSFYSTNPLSSDTDQDTLDDGDEINSFNTDPNKADSDDDTLSDAEEINTHNTNPLKSDSDDDGLSDSEEINTHNTNPQNNDSDSDTLTDLDEISIYNSDPNKQDTDDDGLDDSQEVTLGTDILKADTDGDGVSDGEEIDNETDPLDREDPSKPSGAEDGNKSGGGSIGFNFFLLITMLVLLRKTSLIRCR